MTGLKTKCKAGRPDWEAVLQNIHDNSKHKVCVTKFERNSVI